MEGREYKGMQLDNIFKVTETLLRRNASEIMMGLGITGMFTATFVAVKATPEAIRRIEERKKEEKVEKTDAHRNG